MAAAQAGSGRGTGLWRRAAVVAALMLAAFTFNTTENLPIGVLELISDDLKVSLSAVGGLVTGYGVTVAVVSLPIAHATRAMPRRHVLTALLGALVVASLVSAAGSSYWLLLVARMVTALAQALFWAVMGPVAVGLFPRRVRGRVIGLLSVAGSLALVLGIPAGTWLGQQRGWQVPLVVLAGLGAVSLVVIAALLPTSRPEEGAAAYGPEPDVRRFGAVLATTALSVTGAFAGYTYIVKFLGDVSGFSTASVSTLLMVAGVAGVLGVTVTGPLLDRFPRATLAVPVATQTLGMLGLYALGGGRAAAVAMLALLGASLGPVFMAAQARVLQSAPGRTEIALAANSGAYNAGVALGALLGGALLPVVGVRGTFLVGGVCSAAALTVLGWERLTAAGGGGLPAGAEPRRADAAQGPLPE
ncbi:MFS transporter [Streptomyces varsoviensis]|uniref:MFS transporter n=1 Tax=Streptomyces varsoviensis TaxID=67373 RepID=UPI0006624673|nr:MFS transporter [Streptomyces varsoviensis]